MTSSLPHYMMATAASKQHQPSVKKEEKKEKKGKKGGKKDKKEKKGKYRLIIPVRLDFHREFICPI